MKARSAVLGILLMFGCGGGDGGGEGSAAAGASAAATAASEGPIDAFGSVIVNGVRWNTDEAEFEIEGGPGRQRDLAVGMVVRIEGMRLGDGSSRADRVSFESRLRGPIRRIQDLGPDARALEIFGVRALISRSGTRFDSVGLDDLEVDTVVELSGLVNEVGELEVTHLRGRGRAVIGRTEVRSFGVVSGLAGGSFELGSSEIFFDDTTELDDFGSRGLRNGLQVRVEGILLANDSIDAEEIESPDRDRDDRFDESEIHGIVSDLSSLASFRVAGTRVDASGARLEPDDPGLLREGVRVEVEGRFDALGVLIAQKLKFRSNRARIEAAIASDDDVDPAQGRIWLLDVPIDVERDTRTRDRREDLESLGLDDLRGGDFVEIRGLVRSDGSVVATRMEREDIDDLRLRGPVDMIERSAGRFTILGVAIQTDARTVFESDEAGRLTEGEFFARLRPGVVVKATDRRDGNESDFDFADEVEIEEPDLVDDDEDDDREDDDREDDDRDDDDDKPEDDD